MKTYKIKPQRRISSLYSQGEAPSAKPQGDSVSSHNETLDFFQYDRGISHSFASLRITSEQKVKNLLLFLILFLLFLSGCGKKMDPTLEDYLQPEPVQKITISSYYDKIVVSWSYPKKNKSKLGSFLLERLNNGQVKSLGFFSPEETSFEDKEFAFGETYKYRIFAINKKGIYSKPIENSITTKKLPEVTGLQYKITHDGVLLSWKSENSVMYNIYKIKEGNSSNYGVISRVEAKGNKIGSTEKNYFLVEETFKNLLKPADSNLKPQFLIYLVAPYISEPNIYIEGKGTEIKVPLYDFIPSKPEEVFFTVNENGVYISWKEVPEKWVNTYKVYRKRDVDSDFILIGETMIPLFFDAEYNINSLKKPIFYKISSEGPLQESEPVEIKVEVSHG